MKLVTGGAFQGKEEFARRQFGIYDGWADGRNCSFSELVSARGVTQFQEWIRRLLANGEEPERQVEELLARNPGICIVTCELGCGIVPVDPADREWRERTGRICTELASRADCVFRVVCGIGQCLKKEARPERENGGAYD